MEAEEVVEVVEEVVGNLSLTRDEVTGNLSLGEGMGLRAVDVVQAWVTPALVTVGVTGNVASVLVLSSPKLRALSSSCYLSALAASDTGFLAALLLSWLTLVGHDLYGRPGWCQGIVYATYVTTFLSVWLVVAFTVERFVAVCYPLLRHAVCTVRRARMVVLCLVVTALALYSYLLVVAAPVPHEGAAGGVRCQVRPAYLGVAGAMNHLDTVLALLLPVLTIVTLNVQIARCVWRVERLRSSMTQQGCGDGPDAALGPEPRARQGQGPGPRRGQHKVTKMLLVISTVFISLNLPSYCMRAYVFFWCGKDNACDDSPTTYTLQQTFTLLFYTNFAVNFLLYCVTGQNFRRAVAASCCSFVTASTSRGRRRRRHSSRHDPLRQYSNSTSQRRSFHTIGTSRKNSGGVIINLKLWDPPQPASPIPPNTAHSLRSLSTKEPPPASNGLTGVTQLEDEKEDYF
ncbi:growth hormone secretagogue receptor type 1-like [Portunus trituberculatus]|uniref:growth hormone secretagogue receptor type 1-like n=1 Tax=Portunus trituberculatus TaxID=210409 RepID=UPI001E1CFA23|nr:growth hormone secretagogue receptor type 1-like [Portunus trituberculatus]